MFNFHCCRSEIKWACLRHTTNSYFHEAMTVNAEEMIDLRDIVHRKSIHSGLDYITDGPIGGGSRNFR